MANILIRHLDVCPNPESRSRSPIPFLLVLQSDRFSDTSGVVVAPLVLSKFITANDKLYPVLDVADQSVAVLVTELATVPRAVLRAPLTNMLNERGRIIAALDLLFTGI